MRIDICRASDGVFYDFAGELIVESGEILDREVEFTSPIRLSGRYVTDKGEVYITSKAEADVVFRCDRCLVPVRDTLVFEVDETFVRSDSAKANDEDIFTYESNVIILDEAIRQSLYLAMPIQVLCKEDCKGLCPICGCNLNETTCDCESHEERGEEDDSNNPFAVLKNIEY